MSGKNAALGCLVIGVVGLAALVFIGALLGPSDSQRPSTQGRPAAAKAPKADSPQDVQRQKSMHAQQQLRQAFADNPNVTSVRVTGSLLYIGISESLYRSMLLDRVSANDMARQTVRRFQQLMERQPVTVYFQVNGETVITADYSLWRGEIDVEYRDF